MILRLQWQEQDCMVKSRLKAEHAREEVSRTNSEEMEDNLGRNVTETGWPGQQDTEGS